MSVYMVFLIILFGSLFIALAAFGCMWWIEVHNSPKAMFNRLHPRLKNMSNEQVRIEGYRAFFLGLPYWSGTFHEPKTHEWSAGWSDARKTYEDATRSLCTVLPYLKLEKPPVGWLGDPTEEDALFEMLKGRQYTPQVHAINLMSRPPKPMCRSNIDDCIRNYRKRYLP